MTAPPCPSYAGHRFPAAIISHAVWLYFRFPLSLRHVDEILAARGITVSHETVREWALKFGQGTVNRTGLGTKFGNFRPESGAHGVLIAAISSGISKEN